MPKLMQVETESISYYKQLESSQRLKCVVPKAYEDVKLNKFGNHNS